MIILQNVAMAATTIQLVCFPDAKYDFFPFHGFLYKLPFSDDEYDNANGKKGREQYSRELEDREKPRASCLDKEREKRLDRVRENNKSHKNKRMPPSKNPL
eukprot:TRINITY_DN36530_c1_g1_i1.p2 TRINITY_DN36530_c1_g1~~TRINITY_DN36530_c1_g1_i1.p2  ORF type:complete len:101 (+),score=15.42 TRINITY_DN36530_c1_g1_i1:2586-2888(+)